MLKFPDHQVAGHLAGEGKLGPLIDDSGRFYKPLQSEERGSTELAFYESFSSNSEISPHIRRFFPRFHGTQVVAASDGSGPQPHLVLQDLVAGRANPSIMDIKIGSRTWYTQASDKYIEKCFKKDREGTSVSLGFRISGLKVYQNKDAGFWIPDKNVVKSFTAGDVRMALRSFVSSNASLDPNVNPDCSFVSTIYGGLGGILAQLLELKSWFEVQTTYHFYSTSVLMLYEKEPVLNGKSAEPEVKLVDFAHVVDGEGVIDHNFLGGLCSLIKFINDVVNEAGKNPNKACKVRMKDIADENGR